MRAVAAVDPLSLSLDGLDGRDVVTGLLVLLSAFLCFAAAVGLLRFRDVLSRLHAATKPQVLGIMAIIADVAVSMPSVATITLAVAIIGFQSLTAPLAAHMVGRAAYRTKHYEPSLLLRDEFAAIAPASADGERERGERDDS